jgi:hypothetical protein
MMHSVGSSSVSHTCSHASGSCLAAQTPSAVVVVSTQAARSADLILLDSGYNAGLRSGMICRVTRGNIAVGELVLVDLRPQAAAALIVGLQPHQTIRAGDQVAVKVLKS